MNKFLPLCFALLFITLCSANTLCPKECNCDENSIICQSCKPGHSFKAKTNQQEASCNQCDIDTFSPGGTEPKCKACTNGEKSVAGSAKCQGSEKIAFGMMMLLLLSIF